jgi:hypothetical protein
MTYRNNNLNGSRIQDTSTPNPDIRTGLAIYGLNNNSIANWDETTITYLNAPGITFDGDVGTVDLNSDLTFLGTVAFPLIGTQNHLPIGGELRFCSADLDVFVKNALDSDYTSVTLVAVLIHSGGAPFGNWLNFNYLFNPKEQATLNGDNYDPDGQGNIGNLTSTDNSTGDFSPALAIFDKANVVTDDLCGTAPMNQPPDCSAAVASDVTLSPANGELVPVNILGITDEDDDPVAVTVDAIFQDEPTSGHGSPSPDGSGIGSDTAYLRAERAAKGNGRVYTILFTADDGNGGQCLGDVTVGVPKGNGAAVDDGPSYDSTLP